MKFDEAIKAVEVFDEDLEIESWMPDSKVYEIIEQLREEYAPTVEMTEMGKNYLIYYLENRSFSSLISLINLVRSGNIGDKSTDHFEDLSEEELMQAWLHPETIKVVD